MDSMDTITFTNLSPDLQWADYHAQFEKFGKIVKLYIHPKSEFGKVKFADPKHAKRAQQQLNGKPPLNLIVEPFTEPDRASSKSTRISPSKMNVSSRSFNNSYNANNDIDDEVDVLPSHGIYVDVFGRPLDTLELEDGSEIYVPISELKKSGFEVYTKDSFPKHGSNPRLDKKQLEQFEMYLKVKALKFMKDHNLSFPEETVNNSVTRLRNECVGNPPDERVASPTNQNRGRNAGNQHTGNQQRENRNSFPNRGQKFNNDDKTGSSQNYRNQNNNWNASKSNDGYASKNYSNASKSDWNVSRNSSMNSYKSQGNRRSEPLRRPEEPPFPKTQLNKNKPEEEEDGTFLVTVNCPQNTEARSSPISKPSPEQKLPTPSKEEKLEIPGSEEKSTPKRVISSETVVETPTKPLPSKPDLKAEPVSVSRNRSTVIEKESSSGIFNRVKMIDDETLIGVAMPLNYVEELSELDFLNTACTPDVSFKPNVGDIVAVPNINEEGEATFVRALVCSINNSQYSCALIDYGTEISVCETRRLPEKYFAIPEFACLFKGNPEVIKEISDSAEIPMSVTKPFHVTLSLPSGKTADIVGSLWDPMQKTPHADVKKKPEQKTEPLNVDAKASTMNAPPKEEIFLLPKPTYQLKNGDLVILALEVEGKLHVRTRECDIALKQANQELSKYQGKSLMKPPVVNQLVVCPFEDGVLYRAAILSVDGGSATVEYIDYGNVEKVSLKSIQQINEKLATIPNTIIKITLENVNTPYSSTALEFLNQCSNQRDKFTIALLQDDKFKLTFKDGTSLSDKLTSLDKKSDGKIVLEDIKKCNFSLGSNEAMCIYREELEEGTASFCFADAEQLSAKLEILGTLISDHIKKDDNHYTPEHLEVCLSKFEDDWYRAVCVKNYKNESYGMFYIDYGNTKVVTSEHIRKLPKELADIERVSALCVLEGVALPGGKVSQPLLSKLQAAITEYETYTINVLKEELGCYRITIPSLFEEWKKEGLM